MATIDNLINEDRQNKQDDDADARFNVSGPNPSSQSLTMNSPEEQQKIISRFIVSKVNMGLDETTNAATCPEGQRQAISTAEGNQTEEKTTQTVTTTSRRITQSNVNTTKDLRAVAMEALHKSPVSTKEEGDLQRRILKELMAGNLKIEEAKTVRSQRNEEAGNRKWMTPSSTCRWLRPLVWLFLLPAFVLSAWFFMGLSMSSANNATKMSGGDVTPNTNSPNDQMISLEEEKTLQQESHVPSSLTFDNEDFEDDGTAQNGETVDNDIIDDYVDDEFGHLVVTEAEMYNPNDESDYEDYDLDNAVNYPDLEEDDNPSHIGELFESRPPTYTNEVEDCKWCSFNPSNLRPSILRFLYIKVAGMQFGNVILNEYIHMYRYLNKFLTNFGTFATVQTQMLEERLKDLETYVNGPHAAQYQTVLEMIEFEDASGILLTVEPHSGTIIFACLHRHLEYLTLALANIIPQDPEKSLLHAFESAYTSVLAQYHSWFMEKFYLVGLSMMPTKEQAMILLRLRQAEEVTIEDAMASLKHVVRVLDELVGSVEDVLKEAKVFERIPTQVVS